MTVASMLRCPIRLVGPTSSVCKAREITSACPARICKTIGNLITAYSTDHAPWGRWADGIRAR